MSFREQFEALELTPLIYDLQPKLYIISDFMKA